MTTLVLPEIAKDLRGKIPVVPLPETPLTERRPVFDSTGGKAFRVRSERTDDCACMLFWMRLLAWSTRNRR